jgi:lysophospholipase L1-like esterase
MVDKKAQLDFLSKFDMQPDEEQALVFRLKRKKNVSFEEAAELKHRFTMQKQMPTFWSAKQTVKICADGDSWINILWPASSALGYKKTFVDVLAENSSFYINNLGWPGDTFADIIHEAQYETPIKSGIFDIFIVSAGGNDFLGGGSLVKYVKPYAQGGGSTEPADYIKPTEFKAILKNLKQGYAQMIKNITVWSSRTNVLLQGYDYAIPRENGPWLGKPFSKIGFAWNDPLTQGIIKYSVDAFYAMLKGLADSSKHVHLINARGCCKGNWNDELHPNATASKNIATLYQNEIDRLTSIV